MQHKRGVNPRCVGSEFGVREAQETGSEAIKEAPFSKYLGNTSSQFCAPENKFKMVALTFKLNLEN